MVGRSIRNHLICQDTVVEMCRYDTFVSMLCDRYEVTIVPIGRSSKAKHEQQDGVVFLHIVLIG